MGKDLNVNEHLNVLSQEDTFSTMLLLLYASSDNPKYSTINELAYILDRENFVNFIKYFEGQTITIPSMESIIDSLRLLMLYQYYTVDKLDWREALEKAGYDETESTSAKHRINRFIKHIDKYNYKIGGLMHGSEKR